jgi:hypothetical protein
MDADAEAGQVNRANVHALLLAGALSATPCAQPAEEIPADVVSWLEGQRGTWRSEGLIIQGEKRTKLYATWECQAAVNGIGNVCTWNHEWTDRPHDSALEISGYDPRVKMMSLTRVADNGVMTEPVTVNVRGNTVSVERPITENGKPAVLHNEVVARSRDLRAQRMWVESEGRTVREIIITHRRVQ